MGYPLTINFLQDIFILQSDFDKKLSINGFNLGDHYTELVCEIN